MIGTLVIILYFINTYTNDRDSSNILYFIDTYTNDRDSSNYIILY